VLYSLLNVPGVIIAELDEELDAQSSKRFAQLIILRSATREVLRELQGFFEADCRSTGKSICCDSTPTCLCTRA
jgi:hypothetical protein